MRAYMAIYGGIYGPHGSSNGAYMRAYMGHMGAAIGHAYAHTWPYMGAYMGHMGAAMGHGYWAICGVSPTREGRKRTAGNPFPSLD